MVGSGFDGACDVLLYWGSGSGEVLGRAAVTSGAFEAAVTIPTYVARGSTPIVATGRGPALTGDGCGTENGQVAEGAFRVTGTPPSMFNDTIPLLNRVLRGNEVDAATLQRGQSSTEGIHAIVQLTTLPSATQQAALYDAGINLLSYLNAAGAPGTGYLASLQRSVDDESAAFTSLVKAVQPLMPQDKIDAGLAFASASGPQTTDALIVFFSDVSAARAGHVLQRHGIESIQDGASSTYLAALTRGDVQRLAHEDTIQFLAARPEPGQYDLDVSRDLINVDELQQLDVPSATYLGLTGLGIQLSIHDSGVDDHHNDFAGRMIRLNHPSDGGDHGTHVAGIAAGSGVMSDQMNADGVNNGGTALEWRGMAPQAEIAAYDSLTADSVVTMTDAIVSEGVDVSNHSYSYNDGQYNGQMASIDTIIRGDAGIPARPVIFSAGNQGSAPQYGMNSGYFSLSKSCKNCIMVANLNDDGSLGGGSSHGPTPDGRVKPEIGANGNGVTSTGADVDNDDAANNDDTEDSYRSKGGTSMSTPAVTGTVALLLQQWAEQFGVDIDTAPPLPSTVKAILVQSATDVVGNASGTNPDTGAATVTTAGPDYGSGYGQVDAVGASDLIKQRMFIEDSVATDNVTDNHIASVVPGQDELRVTLAWDDLPGTPNANDAAPTLVNDLDLLLIGPNGEVVRPLVLPAVAQFDCDGDNTNGTQTGTCTPGADPGPWGGVAAPGTDRLNNLEQVVVANPAPGTWRARVSVLNTDGTTRLPLGGTQTYSLAGVTADRADLSVSKSDNPDPATAGEQLFYTISVHNDGPETAYDVVAVDTLPAGVTYVTNDLPGGCVEDPEGTVTCKLGDIESGETVSFRIKVAIDPDLVADNDGPLTIFNTVTVSSTTPDPDTSDNTDTEGTIVEDLADLDVHKMCKPDGPLHAGDTGHCTVFVDNYGPSYARDVTVTNVLLANGTFTISTIQPSQGACTPPTAVSGGKKFVCQLGDLANASPQNSGRATIYYEFSASEEMDINDVATATSSTPDPDDTNNRAAESVHVMAVTDLSITKTGPDSAVAGETANYALSIANDGPSTATGVVIEDTLPAGVAILSVSGSDGATCNAGVPGSASLPTTCSYGNLAPGATRTMAIQVSVLPATRGTIHNDARVTSQTFDDDLSDNQATFATVVSGVADLSIVKTDSPDPVVAGEKLTFTITVTNAGPSTADDVKISDELQPGLTYVSGVDGNGVTVCALVQSNTVVCDLGAMQPGEVEVVYLTVEVAPSVPNGTVIANTATVSSSTSDPDPSDNSSSTTTTVGTQAELWIDKVASQRSGNPSPVVVFDLYVHNDSGCETDQQSGASPTCGTGGPSDAKNVVVTDKLPLDPRKFVVQYVSPQCTYVRATHTVTCSTATIPAGAVARFVIEAQISGSVGTVYNTASFTSSTADPVTGNNTNTASMVMKGGTGKK